MKMMIMVLVVVRMVSQGHCSRVVTRGSVVMETGGLAHIDSELQLCVFLCVGACVCEREGVCAVGW